MSRRQSNQWQCLTALAPHAPAGIEYIHDNWDSVTETLRAERKAISEAKLKEDRPTMRLVIPSSRVCDFATRLGVQYARQIPIRPLTDGLYHWCWQNAATAASRHGGESVLGLAFYKCLRVINVPNPPDIIAEFHVVHQTPAGMLIDVTPGLWPAPAIWFSPLNAIPNLTFDQANTLIQSSFVLLTSSVILANQPGRSPYVVRTNANVGGLLATADSNSVGQMRPFP
jgi:hypothetical protein